MMSHQGAARVTLTEPNLTEAALAEAALTEGADQAVPGDQGIQGQPDPHRR